MNYKDPENIFLIIYVAIGIGIIALVLKCLLLGRILV